MAVFQQACYGSGKRLGLFVGDRGIQGNINLKSLGAGGLGKACKPNCAKISRTHKANLAALHDGGRRARIKIEDKHGGTLVSGARESEV